MEIKEKISEITIYELSDFYKVMGDSTRLKILLALQDGDKNVSTLCEITNMNISAISHQLRILKQADLIRYKKEGKNVIYTLADDHINSILQVGLEHINEK
ncbi:MAG: winged helix-turn-helix transcriptional regulator [Clostridia bacterium]|nr:winged helix-turn-helix transcriptional regulator [Clostridia bacterium]